MSNAVIVVDMLNDFLEPGHPLYVGDEARKIIPNIQKLLNVRRGFKTIFLCDRHSFMDFQLTLFPPHCITGTRGAEIIRELIHYEGYEVAKRNPNGFLNTTLSAVLTWLKPDKLIFCGVCTDCCILQTATTARNYGYAVRVPSNCVASTDLRLHQLALDYMKESWKIDTSSMK